MKMRSAFIVFVVLLFCFVSGPVWADPPGFDGSGEVVAVDATTGLESESVMAESIVPVAIASFDSYSSIAFIEYAVPPDPTVLSKVNTKDSDNCNVCHSEPMINVQAKTFREIGPARGQILLC